MKSTQDLRDYAAEKGAAEETEALEKGVAEKSAKCRARNGALVWFAIDSLNYFRAFWPECVVVRRR